MIALFVTLMAIFLAGLLVGLVCWLPYWRGVRREIGEWRTLSRRVHDEAVDNHEAYRIASRQCDAARREITRLHGNNAALQDQVGDFESRVAQLTQAAETLRREIDLRNDRITGLETDLATKRAELDRLRRMNDELRRVNDELQAAMAELNATLERVSAERDELTKQREALRSQVHGLESEIRQLTDKIEELNTEIDGLRRRIVELEETRDGLTHEIESRTKELDEKNAAIEQLQQIKSRLEIANEELKSQRDQLQREYDELARGIFENGRPKGPISPLTPSAKPVTQYVRLTLGLDFGTHSTKVVFRGKGMGERSWVVRLDPTVTGYPRFTSPSMVRIVRDRIYFGAAALRMHEGKLYRSLKMDVMPVWLNGKSRLPGEDPSVLAALYLAWVLKQTRDALKFDTDKISLNVGAPMEDRRDSRLHDHYLRIVNAAWELAYGENGLFIEQGMPFEQYKPHVSDLLKADVPGLDNRKFEVFPETICPIVSLSRDPREEARGIIMIIDMGAGSTEFSVNSTASFAESDFPVRCYFDKSHKIGGDQFHENSLRALTIASQELGEQKLTDRFWSHLVEVWRSGFQKDKDAVPSVKKAWNELRVIRVGGGLRRESLNKLIGSMKQPPFADGIHDPKNRTCKTEWHRPAELEPWEQTDHLTKDELPLFSVAHGLSVHRNEWPQLVYPCEIAAMPDPPADDRGTWQEPWHNKD